MKLTGESKILLGMLAATIGIIGVGILLLSRPQPTYSRDQLIPKGTQILGNEKASVFLVEFSDYQCPACKAFSSEVRNILKTYGNDMIFAYRDYPLPQHPLAKDEAIAAHAAAKQGKYWDMHDALFANQEKITAEMIGQIAKSLNLNMDQYTKDLKDEAIKKHIEDDISYGERIGINATPTFYLNGKKLNLTTQSELTKLVEQAIQEAKNNKQ